MVGNNDLALFAICKTYPLVLCSVTLIYSRTSQKPLNYSPCFWSESMFQKRVIILTIHKTAIFFSLFAYYYLLIRVLLTFRGMQFLLTLVYSKKGIIIVHNPQFSYRVTHLPLCKRRKKKVGRVNLRPKTASLGTQGQSVGSGERVQRFFVFVFVFFFFEHGR